MKRVSAAGKRPPRGSSSDGRMMTIGSHLSESEVRLFAARSLDDGDSERVCQHLDSCDRCRAEVRIDQSLHAVLADVTQGDCPDADLLVQYADGVPLRPEEARLVPMHLAGCSSCVVILDGLRRAGEPLPLPRKRVDVAKKATTPGLLDRLRALITLEMPPRLALATRAAALPTQRSVAYHQGVADYAVGRYSAALEHFSAARDAGEKSSDLAFFLGACLLQAGRADQAVDALAVAVRLKPRLAEYRWYLAQAQLAVGRGKDAVAQLRRVAASPGSHRAQARSLVETLGKLLADERRQV